MLKIFDNLLLPLLTLMVTSATKFAIVWCHVVKNALKLKASNLNNVIAVAVKIVCLDCNSLF